MRYIICIILFESMISTGWSKDITTKNTFEVFPLSKGLHFQYVYQFTTSDLDMQYGSAVSDSGIVDYQVIDSSQLSDTLLEWTVEEKRHLQHIKYDCRSYANIVDTSYWINSTCVISVYEQLTDMHRLQCNALIWKFPITDSLYGSIGGNVDTSFDIYRYATVGSHLFTCNLWSDPCWRNDSITFQTGHGLVKRIISQTAWSHVRHIENLNVSLLSMITSVSPASQDKPTAFHLYQNFPNPFNPSTTIPFSLDKRSNVRLTIFNILGERISILVDGYLEKGSYKINFNSVGCASGIYLFRLETDRDVKTRSMLLLK